MEGLGFELQSDSIEGDGLGIDNANTESLPLGLAASEQSRFASEIATGFRDFRLAMGLYYRGTSADGKTFQERIPGQNAAIRAMCQTAGISGIAYVQWSPAPYWKVSGAYNGQTYAPPDPVADPSGYNLYEQRLLQGGTINAPDKTADPTGYAAWMDAYSTAVVQSMEYVHQNIWRVTRFSPQNEPDFSTPYPSCTYTNQQMYDFLKAVVPKIRASSILTDWQGQPNRVSVYMDSNNGQSGRGSALVLADSALLAEIDGWAWHLIDQCAADANYAANDKGQLLTNTGGKYVFADENEYLTYRVDTTDARYLGDDFRFANLAMQPLVWFTEIGSPIWYWIHIGKNSDGPPLERAGRALTSWRPVGAAPASEDANLAEGHFTTIPVNWNALKPYLRYMPNGSVRVKLSATRDLYDTRAMAWRKPDGKLVVAVVNKSARPFSVQIATTGHSFAGFGYSKTDVDVALGSQVNAINTTVPAYGVQFWVEP